MHQYAGLLAVLVALAGVAALFLWTAGWFSRAARPDAVPGPQPPAPPTCPVGPEQRAWIEQSLRWCVEQFGEEAARRPVSVPTQPLIPRAYDASDVQIHRLFTKIGDLMGLGTERIELRLVETLQSAPNTEAGGRHIVGQYRRPPFLRLGLGGYQYTLRLGRTHVDIERAQTADPARLAAVIAHELAHQRLLGEGRITPEQADGERLTDLLTVYLGLGVFTANTATGQIVGGNFAQLARSETAGNAGARTGLAAWERLGYLTTREFGFALACYCRLRGERTAPDWARYLYPEPRRVLIQGLAFLAAEDARLGATGTDTAAG